LSFSLSLSLSFFLSFSAKISGRVVLIAKFLPEPVGRTAVSH
jgi:hypothetical protein